MVVEEKREGAAEKQELGEPEQLEGTRTLQARELSMTGKFKEQ